MKRTLALIVVFTIALIVGLSTSVSAAEFPDVPITHVNYDAIMRLTDMGVVAGYDDGTFCPDKEITRTEFCALVARTLGYNKDTYVVKDLPFSDVPENYWGRAYISFCYERGLINGMGDGTFAPADKVTLAQVGKVVVCTINREAEALRMEGEKWYSGYIKVAKLYGLMNEITQEPEERATRANIAQFVYNTVESRLIPEVEEQEPDEEPENPDEENPDEETDEPEYVNPGGDEPGGSDDDDVVEDPGNNIPGIEFTDEELLSIEEIFAQKDYSEVKVILIDPGHNYSGKDIGARIDELNIKEEIVTWQIADKLRTKLEKMGYTVYMTRPLMTDSLANTSITESLQARVDLSHMVLADLYISIHCNMGGGSGTETYCFRYGGYAARIAKIVQEKITDATGLYNRGVKTADFYVCKNTTMPSILIETGFLDTEKDREILTSEDGQNDIAQAIADAVEEYDSMEPLSTAGYFDASELPDDETQEETEYDEET